MTTSTPLRNRAAAAAVTLATTAVLLPGVAAHATTAPAERTMPSCSQADMDRGTVRREARLFNRDFKVTHSARKRISRGTEFSQTVTMSSTNQVSASISGTTTVKADAGAFFAKASAEASVTLAGNKQKTTTDSLEERFTIPATDRDRLFVFYEGVATYRFRLVKQVCSRTGETLHRGKLTSWDKTYENGNVLCPHTRYPADSPRWQIAVAGGC
jgi:hypothetical protein